MKLFKSGATLGAALVTGLLLVSLSGCEQGPAEKSGEKMDNAMDKTGDALGTAMEKTGEALGTAMEKTGEVLEETSDTVKEAVSSDK